MEEKKQPTAPAGGQKQAEAGAARARRRTVRNWVLSVLGIAFVAYVAWDVFLSDNVTPVNLGDADQYAVQPPESAGKAKNDRPKYIDDAADPSPKQSAKKEEPQEAEPAELDGEDLMQGGESIAPESVTENPAPAPPRSPQKAEEPAAPRKEAAPKPATPQAPAESERLFD